MLIGSAEDGHSVAVMEKVVDGFRVISKRQTELPELVAEAVRICKIPNWWHPSTGGPDYIYSGMVGERTLAYFSGERNLEAMAKLIESGIEEGKRPTALAGLLGLSDAKAGGTKQAELVLALARRYQHPLAERKAVHRVEFDLDAPVDVMVDGEVLTLHCEELDVLPAALNIVA